MLRLTETTTPPTVLCPKCGNPMTWNPAKMCAKCLSSVENITEGLQKHVIIKHCPDCNSYLQPPQTWLRAQPESDELMSICLNRLKKFRTVRLVNAKFIWTEPHSMRLKVKLWVQKMVLNGAILEQAYVVDYTVQNQMCGSCSRLQANPDQWVAVVQLRQRVPHRRTFFYLEQLILKHDAAFRAIRIKQMDKGMDFFFSTYGHASTFFKFIEGVVPVRSRSDKQLVSHDSKSNNYNNRYTFSVEICPICREDLICLPPNVMAHLGYIGPVVICNKVHNRIGLFDPSTLRYKELNADKYWETPFMPLLSSGQLVEYQVLNKKEPSEVIVGGSKYIIHKLEVVRVSDYGNLFEVSTHLGHLLNPGDYALGYDLYGANINNIELERYKDLELPAAILIKKSYEGKRKKKHQKPRSWKLKSLNIEVDDVARAKDDEEKRSSEYEQFLRDLEENPEMRFNVSLYRNEEYHPLEMDLATDGEDVPLVPIEELFDDLDLSDDEDDDAMRE